MDFHLLISNELEHPRWERVMQKHYLRYLWRIGDNRYPVEEDLFSLKKLFGEEDPSVNNVLDPDCDWMKTYTWYFNKFDNNYDCYNDDFGNEEEFELLINNKLEQPRRERLMRKYHLRYLWRIGDRRYDKDEEDLFSLRMLFLEEDPRPFVDNIQNPDDDWLEIYVWDFEWRDDDNKTSDEEREWWERIESPPPSPPPSPSRVLVSDEWSRFEWSDSLAIARENQYANLTYHDEVYYGVDSGAEDLEDLDFRNS